jgi:mRNA interferase MazF
MKRGEIYAFALDPTVGSEPRKTRMCVVVRRDASEEAAEDRNPMTIVVPLTDAKGRRGNLLNVFVPRDTAGTTKDSLIVVAQIRAVDKKRLVGEMLGSLPAETLRLVDTGLKAVLSLD